MAMVVAVVLAIGITGPNRYDPRSVVPSVVPIAAPAVAQAVVLT